MFHTKLLDTRSRTVITIAWSAGGGTKYYVTRAELKKRLDEQKKPAKDPIHTSNSNTYYVEDGYNSYDSHELGDGYVDHDSYGHGYGHATRYVAIEKKHSKFFGDELSFVIVVVTLTVFFGILSSLLIPLTLMLINGGGLGGFGGFGLNGLNGILPVIGTPGIGRRRRSVGQVERTNQYAQLFDSALGKFNHNKQ